MNPYALATAHRLKMTPEEYFGEDEYLGTVDENGKPYPPGEEGERIRDEKRREFEHCMAALEMAPKGMSAIDFFKSYKGPRKRAGFVYLISDGEHLKIGMTTKDAQSRLASLQTSTPRQLELVAAIRCANAAEDERAVHELFARHRIRNEWFNDHPDIRTFFFEKANQ